MSSTAKTSKQERREAVREKARMSRAQQQRRERRNRTLVQVAVGVTVLAIVTVVALVISMAARPPGPGPKNMVSGGISLQGPRLTAVTTAAAAAGSTPAPQRTVPGGKVLIQAYEDFGCPNCREFEEQYGPQIQQLVVSGAAVIQYHPVAILDHSFTDNSYSTRAANAAAAISNFSPDAYAKFHRLMYAAGTQPTEGTSGLADDRLISLARRAGAKKMGSIEAAIKNQTFKNWVTSRTDEFTSDSGPLAGVDFSKRRNPNGTPAGPGTPTLIVNGHYWDGTTTFGGFVTSTGGAINAGTTHSTASP